MGQGVCILLAFIPFAGVIGCIPEAESKLGAEESLNRLIYIVGPWALEDQSIAEDFAKRFLATGYATQYLPKSVDLIQSLSEQISNETTAVKEIDLGNIPIEEQELLVTLTKPTRSFLLLTKASALSITAFTSSGLMPSACPNGPSSLILSVNSVINCTKRGASAADAH